MMSLSCKDMGATDCDYIAKGETAQEVKDNMMKHAMSEHKEMMDKMTREEKSNMMAKMDAAMESRV
jgi:predicted small metal-binding protein